VSERTGTPSGDGTATYSLGWGVFRVTLDQYVPADRRRRAVRIGVVVAVAAAVVLVAVGLVLGWPDLGSPAARVGLVLLATGAGAVAVSCVPLGPRPAGTERLSWSGSFMQTPERTERYFRGSRAPTIDPRDREAVLADAELVRAGLVPDVFRTLFVVPATVLVLVGFGLIEAHLRIVGFVSVALVLRMLVSVVRLGRVERARALAEALPPAPQVPTVERKRPSGPAGSKLGLPGE